MVLSIFVPAFSVSVFAVDDTGGSWNTEPIDIFDDENDLEPIEFTIGR